MSVKETGNFKTFWST